jgi:hypothetical protein
MAEPHDAREEYAALSLPDLLRTAAAWVHTASPGNPYGKALSKELADRAQQATEPTSVDALQKGLDGYEATIKEYWPKLLAELDFPQPCKSDVLGYVHVLRNAEFMKGQIRQQISRTQTAGLAHNLKEKADA